jgi:N4-gp56 family major capsid protein
MAQTNFAALEDAQKKVWATDVWQQGRDNSFWFSNGFVGGGEKASNNTNTPIQFITELTKEGRGSRCVMQLVSDLDGDGVPGDQELEGNEEALVNDTQEIVLDQLRHGVRSKGKMAEQDTVVRFRGTAKNKLSFWLGERIDEMLFLMASGVSFTKTYDGRDRSSSSKLSQLRFASSVTAPSTNRQKYAGVATSTSTLTASLTMSWDLIVETRAMAKRKRIKPIRQGGREYYCAVLSTEQAADLKKTADYKNLNKDGNVRGQKNPLFTGALAVIDGVILHEHNKVHNTLGASSGSKWGSGGTVEGAQCLMLGAQALGFARIGDPEWAESDNTDYGNKPGIGYGRMMGMLKPQFRSRYDDNADEDFGVISLYTATA